ncbi:attractin-like isoform X2 [Gordionus sp. m RMFG-2023]|uniref:attractin-like isoform X2 n=1 Tax=Gordionus sp. m RMFG-2023 TaxID=3053472 RepID=UPI0031FD593E
MIYFILLIVAIIYEFNKIIIITGRLPNHCYNYTCYNGFCFFNTCICNPGWTGLYCETCFGRIKITKNKGYISDGTGNYKLMSNCTWVITNKNDRNYKNSHIIPIRLRLNSFSTECGWDYLYIHDGDSIYSPLIGSFSGSKSYRNIRNFPDLVANSGTAYIHFFSDDSYVKSGFNISYWNGNECILSNCSGNGICSNGNCDCNKGWKGKDCEISCTLHPECYYMYPNITTINISSEYKVDSNYPFIVSLSNGPTKAAHSLTDDNMGGLYVIGGYNFDAQIFPFYRRNSPFKRSDTYIYRFDTSTLKWTPIYQQIANMKNPLLGHSAIFHKGKIFVFGGHEMNGNILNDNLSPLQIYDLKTKRWMTNSYNHYGDRGDSYNITTIFDDVSKSYFESIQNQYNQKYNFSNNYFSNLQKHEPIPVTGHTSHLVYLTRNEYLMVVIFGYNPIYGFVPYVQEYNIDDQKWAIYYPNSMGPIIMGRAGHSSIYDKVKNLIYILGGVSNSYYSSLTTSSSEFYVYDPLLRIWKILESSPYKLYMHQSISLFGLILVYGGQAQYKFNQSRFACQSSIFLAYDTYANEWHTLPYPLSPLIKDRIAHSSIIIDNKWYIHGGFNGIILNDTLIINFKQHLLKCYRHISEFMFMLTLKYKTFYTNGSYVNASLISKFLQYPNFNETNFMDKNKSITHSFIKNIRYMFKEFLAQNTDSDLGTQTTKDGNYEYSDILIPVCLLRLLNQDSLAKARSPFDHDCEISTQPFHAHPQNQSRSPKIHKVPDYYSNFLRMAALSLPLSLNTPFKNYPASSLSLFDALFKLHPVIESGANDSINLKTYQNTDLHESLDLSMESPCRNIDDCINCLSTLWDCTWCINDIGCIPQSLLKGGICPSTVPTNRYKNVDDFGNGINLGFLYFRTSLSQHAIRYYNESVKSNIIATQNVMQCPILTSKICEMHSNCYSCNKNPICLWTFYVHYRCISLLIFKTTLYNSSSIINTQLSSNPPSYTNQTASDQSSNGSYFTENKKILLRSCNAPCNHYRDCWNCTKQKCLWCSTFSKCIDPYVYSLLYPFGQCFFWISLPYKCPFLFTDPMQQSSSIDALNSNDNEMNPKTNYKYENSMFYDINDLYRNINSNNNNCLFYKSCVDCQNDPACGWCNDISNTGKGKCLPGGYKGPVKPYITLEYPSISNDLSSHSEFSPTSKNNFLFSVKNNRDYKKWNNNHVNKIYGEGLMRSRKDMMDQINFDSLSEYQRDLGLTCSVENWHFLECPICRCNGHSVCSDGTKICEKCQNNTDGSGCEKCSSGYFGDARNGGLCRKCKCNNHASTCNHITGACHCRTKGIIGTNCQYCDTINHYVGNPGSGGTCYYTLTTDYMFTFNLTKPEDQYYTGINMMNRLEKPDNAIEFKISCSGLPKMNISYLRDTSNEMVELIANESCKTKSIELNSRYFTVGAKNITFYIRLYKFEVPIWIMVSFSNTPKLDILQFFITFLSCFLFLLFVAAVSWKVKQKYDIYRRRQRLFIEMEQMATRPFSSLYLYLESKHPSFYIGKKKKNRPTPIALEPLIDESSAVLSVIVRLPTSKDKYGNPITPHGASGLGLGSTLVSMGTLNLFPDSTHKAQYSDQNFANDKPEATTHKQFLKNYLQYFNYHGPDLSAQNNHNNQSCISNVPISILTTPHNIAPASNCYNNQTQSQIQQHSNWFSNIYNTIINSNTIRNNLNRSNSESNNNIMIYDVNHIRFWGSLRHIFINGFNIRPRPHPISNLDDNIHTPIQNNNQILI